MLGEADVPDDGERYAIIGWKQWSDLLDIDEFANADYVGDDELPWKGTQAKRWLGTLWMPHSGLTKDGSGVRYCYWYHKTAIGHAVGKDVTTDVTWHGDRAAFFINKKLRGGPSIGAAPVLFAFRIAYSAAILRERRISMISEAAVGMLVPGP